jgi:hypothetical protein
MRIAFDSDAVSTTPQHVHHLSDPVGLIQIDADFRIWCGRRKTAQGLFGFGTADERYERSGQRIQSCRSAFAFLLRKSVERSPKVKRGACGRRVEEERERDPQST